MGQPKRHTMGSLGTSGIIKGRGTILAGRSGSIRVPIVHVGVQKSRLKTLTLASIPRWRIRDDVKHFGNATAITIFADGSGHWSMYYGVASHCAVCLAREASCLERLNRQNDLKLCLWPTGWASIEQGFKTYYTHEPKREYNVLNIQASAL